MAQRLSKIALLRNRQTLTCKLACKLPAMRVQAGDTIMIDNTRMGWTAKIFEVSGFQFRLGAGEPGVFVELELQEMSSTVYDWSTTEEQAVASSPNTTLPDPWTVAAPNGLALASSQATSTQKADGTWIGRIHATWNTPAEAFVEDGGRIEVQMKLSSDPASAYETIAILPGNVTEYYIGDVDEGEEYDVRIRAISILGVRSAWDEDTDRDITVDTTAPGVITSHALAADTVNLVDNTRDVWFTWTKPSDTDLNHVLVQWKAGASPGPTWDGEVHVGNNYVIIRNLSLGQTYFRFTSVDRSGNQGGTVLNYVIAAYTQVAAQIVGGMTIGASGDTIKEIWQQTFNFDTGGSVAVDASFTANRTVTGARVGDWADVTPTADEANLKLSARVISDDTVQIRAVNTHSTLGVGYNANVQLLVLDIT
jgi:hypothetical protein